MNSIWDHPQVLQPPISSQFQITLGEGNTPLQQFQQIYLKREDLNPTGSVKDRGLAYQLSSIRQAGHSHVVLSSSGNAGISAAKYCQQAKINLTLFVSPHIDSTKRAQLETYPIQLITDSRPVSSAFRFAKQHQLPNLRPSQDPAGPVGYRTIAAELLKQLSTLPQAIFFPVSSATTLVGVAQGFQLLNRPLPRLYAIQTTATHPLAATYDSQFTPEQSSLATGLVAKSMPLKATAQQLIHQSSGSGHVVSNDQIQTAYRQLHDQDILVSYDAAVSLAGYQKALNQGITFDGPVVCLLTGTQR